MDTRILALLLVLGVAGSLAHYQEPYVRVRRSTAEEDAKSVTPVLTRVHRTAAPPNEDSENSTAPTTPVSTEGSSATEASSTPQPDSKTSSTPKSTEQTPAASTPAPTSASASDPIQSRVGEEDSPAAKPKDDNALPTSSPSKPTSKPAASTPSDKSSGKPATQSRSNFDDDADKPSMDNSGVRTVQMSNLPVFNPIPNVDGWAQSGANSWASASSSGYAGTGAIPFPYGGDALQSRSGFQVDPGFSPDYYNRGGPGFYDPNPFADHGAAADPAGFQRLMEDYFKNLQAQLEAQHNAIWQASNYGQPNGDSFPSGPNTAPAGPQASYAGVSVGPQGGYQTGYISPVGPGVESRFAEDVPAPSGGSYGVFSSSRTSTRIGPDGRQISHKQSTTGVNDNGKITFRTVED